MLVPSQLKFYIFNITGNNVNKILCLRRNYYIIKQALFSGFSKNSRIFFITQSQNLAYLKDFLP